LHAAPVAARPTGVAVDGHLRAVMLGRGGLDPPGSLRHRRCTWSG